MRGRPKKYEPPNNPFAVLRRAESLGCEIRDHVLTSQKGKKVKITAKQIIDALHNNEKIEVRDKRGVSWVDPKTLYPQDNRIDHCAIYQVFVHVDTHRLSSALSKSGKTIRQEPHYGDRCNTAHSTDLGLFGSAASN